MFVLLARRPRLRRAVTLQSRSAGRRDARGRSAAAPLALAASPPRRVCTHVWDALLSTSAPLPLGLRPVRGQCLSQCSVPLGHCYMFVYFQNTAHHWQIWSNFDLVVVIWRGVSRTRIWYAISDHSRDPYPCLGLGVYYIRLPLLL